MGASLFVTMCQKFQNRAIIIFCGKAALLTKVKINAQTLYCKGFGHFGNLLLIILKNTETCDTPIFLQRVLLMQLIKYHCF